MPQSRVQPGWLLATTALTLLLLLFGISYAFNLRLSLPGVTLSLPETRHAIAAASDVEPILITGGASPRIYYQGLLYEVASFEVALRTMERPRQFVLFADRQAPVDLVLRLAETGLVAGHEIALGGRPPGDAQP